MARSCANLSTRGSRRLIAFSLLCMSRLWCSAFPSVTLADLTPFCKDFESDTPTWRSQSAFPLNDSLMPFFNITLIKRCGAQHSIELRASRAELTSVFTV
jgi:hypothetical protein